MNAVKVGGSNLTRGLVALITGLLSASVALAQSDAASRKGNRMETGSASQHGFTPARAAIEAGQANGTGKITIALQNGFAIGLSAPTDKASNATDFTNLDGLANNFAGGISWVRVLGGMSEKVGAIDRQRQICDAIDPDKKVQCIDTDLASFLRETGRSSEVRNFYQRWDDVTYEGGFWSIRADAKVGHKDFEYFELDGAQQKDGELSWSAGFGASRIWSQAALAFGLTYQDSRKESTVTAQQCSPIDGSSVLEDCETLPLGPPSTERGGIARIEGRRIFGAAGRSWGLAPLASYDFEMDVVGIDIPIYFVPDDKGRLTGGVRVGWRSDTDEVVASIFVSKAFGLP